MSDAEKIAKLREWVAYEAACPCCFKSDVCLSGCTYQYDDPDMYECMKSAREVLEATK